MLQSNIMYFLDFVENGNYPLRADEYVSDGKTYNRVLLLDALKEYILSPIVISYFDAIKRRGSPALLAEIKQKSEKLQESFIGLLNEHKHQAVFTLSAIWDELTGQFKKHPMRPRIAKDFLENIKYRDRHNEYTHGVYEQFLRQLLVIFEKNILDFINFITFKGNKFLIDEFTQAIRIIKTREYNIFSFIEFCEMTWRLPFDSGAKLINIYTLQQFLMYLQYLDYFVYPYLCMDMKSNQSVKQAVKLKNIIEKIRNKYYEFLWETDKLIYSLESAKLKLLEINIEISDINTQQEKEMKNIIMKAHPFLKDEMQPFILSREIAKHVELNPAVKMHALINIGKLARSQALEHAKNMLLQEVEQLKKDKQSLGFFMSNNKGELNFEDSDYKELSICFNYWAQEVDRINTRKADMQHLQSCSLISASETYEIYRNVTIEEANNIRSTGRFLQGGNHYEREKWFYGKKASPGDGVAHPYTCTIFLSEVDYHKFLSIKKLAGLSACVTIKPDAEPDCFGIHEDALEAFNFIINKIRIQGNKPTNCADVRTIKANSNKSIIDFFANPSIQETASSGRLIFGKDFQENYKPVYG